MPICGLQCFGFDNTFNLYRKIILWRSPTLSHFISNSAVQRQGMEHAVTTVALQNERYLISILHLIDCLRVALVPERYGENGTDSEENKYNQRYICNTNAFIFSTCSCIFCVMDRRITLSIERKKDI